MTNNLEKNLELRKALAEVDRLTALNLELETVNNDLWNQQVKAIRNIENRIMHTKDSIETIKNVIVNENVQEELIRELKIEMEAYTSFLKLIK
tara:strand:- start:741 stop:1019 length:279 start_codon:yes stop_codon:yes gene_type:complete